MIDGIIVNFGLSILASSVAFFLCFYIVLFWVNYGTRISVSRGYMLSSRNGYDGPSTVIDIQNRSPFSIGVIRGLELRDQENEAGAFANNADSASEIIIPRFESGRITLPGEIIDLGTQTRSVILRYHTIDAINMFVAKNILDQYRNAYNSRQYLPPNNLPHE